MIQLTPQSRIFVATEPVDFRKGIDGLGAVCRQVLGDNPLEGAIYVFRNRSATATVEIDLERPDGARLHLRCPESTAPVAALVRAFLEGTR